MIAELNSVSFGDFVKLADVLFIRGASSVRNAVLDSGMVRRVDIPENSGNTREFSEVDTNEYLTYKAQSDQAARGRAQQGYSKTMTKHRMAENLGISYEWKHENKYPDVARKLIAGGAKGYNTIDRDLSHWIGFGTATTYTDNDGRTITISVGDGYQLFYTAHTLKASTTTFRNRLANNPRLSKGALEGMERLVIEQTYNSFGEVKSIPFDIIWTTADPNTVNTAKEYLTSVGAPDAAHAGVTNAYDRKYTHRILPRVATTAGGAADTDKRYYWGLASSELTSFYVGIWEEPHMIPPSPGSNAEDPQTDDMDFRVRAGYGITIVGSNWIKFSSGDGSA